VGEDVGQPCRGERVGVDVAVGQRHDGVIVGDGPQPFQVGRGFVGAAARPGDAVHGVGAGGHDRELLDEGGIDRHRHGQRGDRFGAPRGHGGGQPLEHGEGPVQSPAVPHGVGQLVVAEAARG
jgi:hypothetical protein